MSTKRCTCGKMIDANCTKCPNCGKVTISPLFLIFLFVFLAFGGWGLIGC